MKLEQKLQQYERLTWPQKQALAERWAHFISLTLTVWLRRDLGYRVVNPIHLLTVALGMFLLSALCPNSTGPAFLRYYAVLVVFCGLYQRFFRWREHVRGVAQHSYYVGSSPFEWPWLPQVLRSERRIPRFVDPLFCVVTGYAIVHVLNLKALGYWWVFAGACLRISDAAVYRKEENRRFDLLDGLSISEQQTKAIDRFTPKAPTSKSTQNQPSVSTGLSPDLQAQIARNKTKH